MGNEILLQFVQNSLLEVGVYVKAGKYGKYLEWNGHTQSLKHLKQPICEITLEDVLEFVYDWHNSDSANITSTHASDADTTNDSSTHASSADANNKKSSILRVINEDASIRKGNYGNYIFYKNSKMKKPRFLKLDGFSGDYLTCELTVLQKWLKTKYDV